MIVVMYTYDITSSSIVNFQSRTRADLGAKVVIMTYLVKKLLIYTDHVI